MRMEPVWMSQHRAFGETGMSALSLMYVCSTFLRPAIVGLLSMQPTHVMRISKREAMSGEIKKLNMAHSHSASGGMVPAATTTFKRLASLISNKQQQDYNKTITWIRCLLSFSLVRSSVMCLRGAHSSYHCPARPDCGGCGPLRRLRPNLLNYKLYMDHFCHSFHHTLTFGLYNIYIANTFFTHSHSNYTDISKKKVLMHLDGEGCVPLSRQHSWSFATLLPWQ